MAKTKILIAIDEPAWAKTIVQTAYNLIDRKNSEITLLNVVETNIAEENLFYSEPEKFIKHEAGKSDFALLEYFLENSDVDYKGFIYKEGNAAETIIKIVENEKYDLTVVGSHNKSALERIFLGSVTHKITRYAKSSVLVINNRCNIEIDSLKPFSIIMGVDISQDSFYMAENLWKFIDINRAQVTLLNVTVPPSLVIPPDAYIYMNLEEIIKEAAIVSENILENVSNKLKDSKINVVKKYHLVGDAASTILDEADAINHNFIAVGSHSSGDISRWLLGSVSTKVYEHARQPVLIIY